jgi:uncharacterized protein YqgV (UPF0045/DUF77 family)
MTSIKNKVNLSFQLIPINCSDSYSLINEAIYTIQHSGIKHEVQPFATIMEGDLNQLLEIVLQAKNAVLNAGADELVLNIQIHLKKDADVTFEEKTDKFR